MRSRAGAGSGRTALCHEWLSQRSGSEKTFEAMADAFPAADLYALTRNPHVPFSFAHRPVGTTLLDRLGPIRERRELQLPLMPLAWRYASRRPYEVVVTSSHACAKGFWPARAALHLCYCYTPMRYLWLSGVDQRRRSTAISSVVGGQLRRWDRMSAGWVDEFAAISTAVQRRIAQIYGREAVVIHPPVATDYFSPSPGVERGEFVLAVSRMVGYKRLDLAIRACAALDQPLVIAGWGAAEQRLRALAQELGAAVTFVISPPDEVLRDLYRRARVLVFPADEDFGIVAVEAQACGTPVVAFARGGSLDTVIPGVTGSLVASQDPESFSAGIGEALDADIDPAACRGQAERFSADRFRAQFRAWVEAAAAARGIDIDRLCSAPGP